MAGCRVHARLLHAQHGARVVESPYSEEHMYREMVVEGKSRYEIIVRAKLSWNEAGARTSQRDWINRELAEIGMTPLTDDEMRTHGVAASPRLL